MNSPEKNYIHKSWQAVAALIAVLAAVSFIPPQSIGGVKLRRANILSDLLVFDDSQATAAEAEPQLFDEEEFHVDISEVAERIVADTLFSEVQTTFLWDPAQVGPTAAPRHVVPDTVRWSAALTPIEEADTVAAPSFRSFCDTLLAARRPVRIAVLGDSFIEGDILTADLRGQPAGGADKIVCGVVLIDMTNQFFVDMIEGGNKAAEDYGCEVIWKSADGNFDNQISLIENFIEQGVDCILVDPLDSEGLKPVIEKASAAGIPTITMAGQVDVETNYTTVYNDEENTRIIAEMTAKMIGEEGKTALLYGNKGNLVSDLRQKGYYAGMEKYPNITVVEQPTNWDPPTGMKAAQDLIAANPDLKAIHCISDAVTLAAYQAVKTAGKEGEIIVTSYDGNDDALKAVESGQFTSTVLTGAKKTGYWNIQVALQLASGVRPAEKILNLDTHFVMTDENKAKFAEMGIEGTEDVSVINPAQALERAAGYRDELYDPDLLAG